MSMKLDDWIMRAYMDSTRLIKSTRIVGAKLNHLTVNQIMVDTISFYYFDVADMELGQMLMAARERLQVVQPSPER